MAKGGQFSLILQSGKLTIIHNGKQLIEEITKKGSKFPDVSTGSDVETVKSVFRNATHY